MVKLNVVVGENRRLVLFGLSEVNMRYLFEDRPILMSGDQLAIRGLGGVSITGVKDVGHFISTVAKAMQVPAETVTVFIDGYRSAIKKRDAWKWIPLMKGNGRVHGTAIEGDVICYFLVKEAADYLMAFNSLAIPGVSLGLREWDRVVFYYGKTEADITERLIDKVLPGYDATPAVIEHVRRFLEAHGEAGAGSTGSSGAT